MDALSLPERELARDLAPALRQARRRSRRGAIRWDGEMDGDSTTATVVEGLRLRADAPPQRPHADAPARGGARREAAGRVSIHRPLRGESPGAVPVLHSLSSLGINFLDGTTLPGNGDAFTLHVQIPGYSQSFRAVWDVGNWDAGGITIPQGESGEPGSGHYTDQAAAWIAGRLWPLPFSDEAVEHRSGPRDALAVNRS